MNKGSTLDPNRLNEIEDHCLEVKMENLFTMTMTLNDVDSFFSQLFQQFELLDQKRKGSEDCKDET